MNFQNPTAIFQMMNLWNRFKQNHPKFPQFLSAVAKKGIKEGSIIEVNVTTAQGENFSTNLRISASDMELIEQLKNLSVN